MHSQINRARRRSFALGLGFLALGAPGLRAQSFPAPAPPDGPILTLAPAWVSEYMFRGQRIDGEAWQPSIDATKGAWDLGVWSSWPMRRQDRVPGESDPEIDPYGSYTITLRPNLTLQPGFTWFTVPKAPTGQGFYRMTFEPNFGLNVTAGGITLTPKVYYDLVYEAQTYELSAAAALPLKSLGTELDFNGTAGLLYDGSFINHAAPKVQAWGGYWLLGASVPIQIGPHSKFTAGLAYTHGYVRSRQGRGPASASPFAVGRTVVSLTYARSF
jgi:hypothetical protein